MDEKIGEWGIGEVLHHTWHGRCVVKGYTNSFVWNKFLPQLVLVREDGNHVSLYIDSYLLSCLSRPTEQAKCP